MTEPSALNALGTLRRLIADVKRLLEQAKEWDEDILCTCAPLAVPSASASIVSNDSPAFSEGKRQRLAALFERVHDCIKCPLGLTRNKLVFGVGDPQAVLMFIGEGPGFDEDHQGEPFVGKAGQLLTKIIESIGRKRAQVYIANIVKCHPMIDPAQPERRGNDRPPTLDEIAACRPILQEQIAIIHPKVICTLGNWAARSLLNTIEGISRLRGRWHAYAQDPTIQIMPTYHPAALLRNPALKRDVWEDMKQIRAAIEAA